MHWCGFLFTIHLLSSTRNHSKQSIVCHLRCKSKRMNSRWTHSGSWMPWKPFGVCCCPASVPENSPKCVHSEIGRVSKLLEASQFFVSGFQTPQVAGRQVYFFPVNTLGVQSKSFWPGRLVALRGGWGRFDLIVGIGSKCSPINQMRAELV